LDGVRQHMVSPSKIEISESAVSKSAKRRISEKANQRKSESAKKRISEKANQRKKSLAWQM